MKTKQLFQPLFIIALSGMITLAGCKKDEETNNADTQSLEQLSKDENRFQDETDQLMNDANIFIMQGQMKSGDALPCNANLDSVRVISDTVVFYVTYNGLNCSGKINRTGKKEIRIPQGTYWVQPGATIEIKLINYTATRVATGKTIVLNGKKLYTNVTGGHFALLGITYDTIIHEVTGNLQAAFENNTSRTWSLARRKTFTGSQSQLQVAVEGFGTSGEYSNLVTWGTNRNGVAFYSQIIQPLIVSETCGFDIVSGIKKHMLPSESKSATLTFGYNSNNQPVEPGECPTKYRLDWEKPNASGTIYLFLL